MGVIFGEPDESSLVLVSRANRERSSLIAIDDPTV